MRTVFVVLAASLMGLIATGASGRETTAVSEPQAVANPPLSWVCFNPQIRQYQALKASSLRDAQRSVGGDSSTRCEEIPVALDPERVAYELNTREQKP